MRKKKEKWAYTFNAEEFKAYHWCVNNGIYITPYCKENFLSWYIDIKINGKVNRSPGTFDNRELWETIFNYYKHYYIKNGKK